MGLPPTLPHGGGFSGEQKALLARYKVASPPERAKILGRDRATVDVRR